MLTSDKLNLHWKKSLGTPIYYLSVPTNNELQYTQ